MKASSLAEFCEVYIPQAPSVFTYGVPEGVSLERGSVVWVQLANCKKPVLALVSKVTAERPEFDVRCAFPHASGYVPLSGRHCADTFVLAIGRSLDCFRHHHVLPGSIRGETPGARFRPGIP